jgi:hypothetical protein
VVGEMNINDNYEEISLIKGKALANLPYRVENVNIYVPTMLKIFDVGEDVYNYYIHLLTLDMRKTIADADTGSLLESDIALLSQFTTFDMLIVNILEDENLWFDVIRMFEFFLCKEDEKINFVKNSKGAYFYIGNVEENRIITRDNFDKIVAVVKVQNDVIEEKDSKKKYNPANKKVSEFIRKMEERQANLNRIKKRSQINMKT